MDYDNIHFTFNEIDGYNAPVNFCESCRGVGKTTAFWRKSWGHFANNGEKTIVQTRNQIDITEPFIKSIHDELGKFNVVPTFSYAKKELKEGMVDVYVSKKHYLRILAMSTPLKKLKNMFLDNVAYWWADEFICNERLNEHYVKGEAFKFKEAWTTFYRESPKMKVYLSGNPYSSYNPYFSEFGIDPAKLTLGKIISGPDPLKPIWVAQRYKPNDDLVEILKKNPMYADEFSEYTKYALNGESVNDKNIYLMSEKPTGYFLRFIFKIEGKLLGVWENGNLMGDPTFWIGFEKDFGSRREAYCFDFKDLSERTIIFSHDERNRFGRFRMAIRNRDVAFQSIECDYFIEEIYSTL